MRLRIALAVLAAASIAACSSGNPNSGGGGVVSVDNVQSGNTGYHGVLLDKPYVLPAAQFTGSDGKPFRLADVTKPVTLIFFGYTNCPDVCSTEMADLASALRRADPATKAKVQVVFITTDPKRDTPSVLTGYLHRFDPSFYGATADISTIAAAAKQVGVSLTGNTVLASGGYDVGHTAQVVGFARRRGVEQGRLVWLPGTPVGDLRADFEKLVNST